VETTWKIGGAQDDAAAG
jgi:site-specific recombinase XerD